MPNDTRSRRVRMAHAPARPRRARTPEAEGLEGRRLPAVFVVNSLADLLSPPAGTVTLRSAIEAANQSAAMGGNNTIDLSVTGTYRITTLGTASDNSAGEFAIIGADGYSLTIANTSGGRAVIDGGGLNRVFDVNPAAAPGAIQVTFRDLTITDGVANGDGGGIRALGAAGVTLQNADLVDNVASGGGGGVSVATGVLNFLNSTVVGNNADHGGGGATDSSSDTHARDSFFEGNVAANSGGALDIAGEGRAILDRDDFTANLASSGGAIAEEAGMIMSNCTLDRNSALRGDGGALLASISARNSGNEDLISSSLFLDNAAQDASLGAGGAIDQSGGTLGFNGSQFTGNAADASGGAIDFAGITLNGANSTIDHSRAGGEGGALDFAGTGLGLFGGSGSSLINVTLASNSASGGGGGIYDAGTGDLGLLHDTINANDGGQGGGGIDLASGGTLAVAATILAQDTASLTGRGPDVLTGPTSHVTDEGSNLVGDASGAAGFNPGALIGSAGHAIDPGLGPLLDNGAQIGAQIQFVSSEVGAPGSTRDVQTEALSTTSPAFNAVSLPQYSYYPLMTDERGFPLPATTPSIGAYQPQYAATATPAQVYVEDLYEVLLNRTADPGGVAYWSPQVSLTNSNAGLVQRFVSSTEYREDQIDLFYVAYLGRLADGGGVSYWLTFLDHGNSLAQAQSMFLGSSEYFDDHGGNGVTVVESIYENLLDRVPTTVEVDGWLQADTPPSTVALDFLLSREDVSDLIEADYAGFLGREPSQSEVAGWLGYEADSTDPKAGLIEAFLGAPESFMDRT